MVGERGNKLWEHSLTVRYHVRRMLRVAIHTRQQLTTEGFANLGVLPVGTRSLPALGLERGSYPAKWETVRCDAPGGILVADIDRTGTGRWILILTRKHPYYYGSQSCLLRFSFTHNGKTLPYKLDDPITFRIAGPVKLVPDSVFFGLADPQEVLKQRVTLWVKAPRRGQPFRISSVRAGDRAHLNARVLRGGQAVGLSLHTTGLSGRVAGHIIITVSSMGRNYRFRVDYLAYVLGKEGEK
jgi:hypothetical protein